jgi:ribonuclease HII
MAATCCRPAAARPVPDRVLERAWQACGARLVAGVDEAGRGPLAGPVVAAAVLLPCESENGHPWLCELRDSKLLAAPKRERVFAAIRRDTVGFGVGVVPAARIDAIGIAVAAREAMRLAVNRLPYRPDVLLLDAFLLPEVPISQQAVIRGDGSSSAIAAASIVAKVARDRIMDGLDRRFPGYGFARNRGYGTAEHLAALARLGPSAVHRFSFAPVRELACVEGPAQP